MGRHSPTKFGDRPKRAKTGFDTFKEGIGYMMGMNPVPPPNKKEKPSAYRYSDKKEPEKKK